MIFAERIETTRASRLILQKFPLVSSGFDMGEKSARPTQPAE